MVDPVGELIHRIVPTAKGVWDAAMGCNQHQSKKDTLTMTIATTRERATE
jgi:hypothetical protein